MLPWMNLPTSSKDDKYRMIKEKKMNTPLSELTRNLPAEILNYMIYVKGLGFDEQPNYKMLW